MMQWSAGRLSSSISAERGKLSQRAKAGEREKEGVKKERRANDRKDPQTDDRERDGKQEMKGNALVMSFRRTGRHSLTDAATEGEKGTRGRFS